MNDITQPLILSRGSHSAGSGRGCAMNVISWENGDTTITDYPACSDQMLSRIVQGVNDSLADSNGFLSPENSIIALDLGHATVGTSGHGLSKIELQRVYVRCAVLAAEKVVHLSRGPHARRAIAAAKAWADDPTEENAAAAAAYAAYASADASYAANAYADANAAYAASANAAAAAAYAAYASYAAYDAYAAYAAYASEFKIDLAWEIIGLFKELTKVEATPVSAESSALACERMLARA